MKGLVAAVAVEKTAASFDMLFSYLVPEELKSFARAGMRVLVPFGRGDRKRAGIIFSVKEQEYDGGLKSIFSAAEDGIFLKDELVSLAERLRETTLCTYYDAARTMLPPGLSLVFDEKSGVSRRRVGDETERTVRLTGNDTVAKLSPKQRKVLETLEEVGTASLKEICYLCAVTASVVKNLEAKGLLLIEEAEVSRAVSAGAEATESLSELVFSPAQQKVFDGLKALMDEGEPKCALLHGVTGSGKTSVFIKLIEAARDAGRTALLLVPEISLTPQTVRKFQSLFGSDVAITHSSLSLGQRADEFKRIERGEAKIVIGTRSAVFAPLENIGIIIIDEEDEHTYKSEMSPRYHAREVAALRCAHHNALLLLASATPSFDSYTNARNGRYSLFELTERYNETALPDVRIVDMRVEAEEGNRGNFSRELLEQLQLNLDKGEQSMLLLNRRGYNTYVNCISCGAVAECPGCGLPLTYHKINDSLMCHLCGYRRPMGGACGKCGSKYIYRSGTGTQRIEDEIHEYFPDARVLRMDADTTMSKYSYEKCFRAFRDREYDIMVGTQMIAKGLDFENVTLVGVLLIDRSLYAGDYLGYEKTFSLITQVVGRCGRGSKKGRAYLQTFTPDHYVLELAARQDYKEFYAQEIEVRRALIFPPFCDICLIVVSSAEENRADAAARLLLDILKSAADSESGLPIILLGPTGGGRINGVSRSRIVMKCRRSPALRRLLREAFAKARESEAFRGVSFYADFNGEL